MFNHYPKKVDTSGRFLMRIEKRERVLGIVIAEDNLYKPDKENPKLTRFVFYEDNPELFAWEQKMIDETGWLFNKKNNIFSHIYIPHVSWEDTNKLRIYHKWLHRGEELTLTNVLKYFYSPFLPAIMLMKNGELMPDYGIKIEMYYSKESILLFQKWLKEMFDIDTVCVDQSKYQWLMFFGPNADKLLATVEPIVQQVPSLYFDFYGKTIPKVG